MMSRPTLISYRIFPHLSAYKRDLKSDRKHGPDFAFLSQNLSISCLGENKTIAMFMSGEDVILNCRYQICLGV